MEQGNFDFEEVTTRQLCAEMCPYLLHGELQERQANTAQKLGPICVTDADLEYNLRAYQTRDCKGPQTWNEETGTVFCSAKSQVFAENGELTLHINSEQKNTALLKKHHADKWRTVLEETTYRTRRKALVSIRDVANGKYTEEEIQLARIDVDHESFATQRSHPDLSEAERKEISKKMQRIKEVSEAVQFYDQFLVLTKQGKGLGEVMEAILADRAEEIEASATMLFGFELHQIKKEWF